MSTVYRSPNLVLGDYEWHLRVENRNGRVSKQFYFRPLVAMRCRWQPMPEWRTRLPDGFSNRFQPYRRHALVAMEAERKRAGMVLAREQRRALAQAA